MIIYALIPARSGSKRIKNKNILKLNNKNLIQITIEQALKTKEINKIFVSTDSKIIQKVAKNYGATHTINSSETEFVYAAQQVLKGNADVVIDGTGNPKVIEKALELTGAHGRGVGFGVMPDDQGISLNTLPLHFGKSLKGSEGGVVCQLKTYLAYYE